MVTSRRHVVNEQDRYGGYSKQPMSRISIDDSIDTSNDSYSTYNNERIDNGYSARIQNSSRRAAEKEQPVIPEPIQYSTNRMIYPKTAEFVGTSVGISRRKKTAKREAEDLMPSIKTRKLLQENIELEQRVRTKGQTKVQGKTKAVLVAYIAVVMVIAVVVIATGIAISGANLSIGQLESKIADKNSIITTQQGELDRLSDSTTLTGLATDLGMVKTDNVREMELVPVTDPIVYEKKTNWFDKFCDWLSGIIGG